MSRAITESNWRNFKPVAPDLEVDAKKGVPLEIPLTEYMVQGARDLIDGAKDQDEIDEHGAQRGWMCQFFNTSRPTKGRVSRSLTGNGFRYTSAPWFVGKDCFTYIMNNGTQNSLPGKIIVNVEDYGEARILIEEDTSKREKGKRAFRYIAQWYPLVDIGSYHRAIVNWYVHKPIRYIRDGVTYVRQSRELVQSTSVTQDVRYSTGFQYREKNWTWPNDGSFLESSWPDPKLVGAIDELTGLTYQQPAGPWPVSIEVSLRRTRTIAYKHYFTSYRWDWRYRAEWSAQESLEADVRTLYGDDWWRRGQIIDVYDPGYTPQLPGEFTP
tara:strand:+ start:15248 stop:16225 length:978 start_codon:yes stop_codon:yes gene_type:complete